MRNVLILISLVALTACTLGPDYKRPKIDLPHSKLASTHLTQQEEQAMASWWTRFDDPVLDHLISQALSGNLQIALQVEKVRQARAELGLTNAQQYPTISGQANAARNLVSTKTGGGSQGASRRYNSFSIAASLSYELDVFGGLRRASEAARARLLSSAYTQDSIRLTVVSDVVTDYMSLRSLQRQIRVTRQTIQTRQKGLSLDQQRYKYGAIDKLTLLQTRSLLQSAQAQLPSLQEQEAKLRTSLAILTGKTPRQIMQDTAVAAGSFNDIKLPNKLPRILPSLLVERRPDVRASEASLIAANASVGQAKAQFFPSFNLSAMIGTDALNVSNLFSPGSEARTISGAITAPILDFGRNRANYRSAKAQKQQAVIAYRQTLRQAFKEVQDALVEIQYTSQHLQAVRSEVQSYKETLHLAKIRYEAGTTNYFNVLDAQRNVFSSELNLATAIRDRFTATADLFKALGGGWTEQTDSLTPSLQATADKYDPTRQRKNPTQTKSDTRDVSE